MKKQSSLRQLRKKVVQHRSQPVLHLPKLVPDRLLAEVLQVDVDWTKTTVPLSPQQWLLKLRMDQLVKALLAQMKSTVLPSRADVKAVQLEQVRPCTRTSLVRVQQCLKPVEVSVRKVARHLVLYSRRQSPAKLVQKSAMRTLRSLKSVKKVTVASHEKAAQVWSWLTTTWFQLKVVVKSPCNLQKVKKKVVLRLSRLKDWLPVAMTQDVDPCWVKVLQDLKLSKCKFRKCVNQLA